MSGGHQIIVAFDLYGTLLDTKSIKDKLGEHFGQDNAAHLAVEFRKYQLEYTWRINSMQQYVPFNEITLRSLLHTLKEVLNKSLSPSDSSVRDIMAAYDALSTFPDVSPALKSVAADTSITPVVFSNGTNSMVTNSVTKSPDLSPHASVFKDIITVEDVEASQRCFKPAPPVYRTLAQKMGKTGKEGEMWLVSGNPFDVVGARAAGMQAAWVDRAGNGWADGLVQGEKGRPTVVLKSLEHLVGEVKKFHGA